MIFPVVRIDVRARGKNAVEAEAYGGLLVAVSEHRLTADTPVLCR